MSYMDFDDSIDEGRPYFLYQFASGSTTTRFVAGPNAVTKLANTWDPSSVSHKEYEQTGNVERNNMELTFPLSDEFALTRVGLVGQIMSLTIFRGHYDDPDEEHRTIWKGRIVGCKSAKQNIIMVCENVFTSLRRPGCRVRVQVSCRHDLYGQYGCRVDKDDFATAAIVTGINGVTLTIPLAGIPPDGYFTAGMIKWGDLYGTLELHVGTAVNLIGEIPGLEEAFEADGNQAVTLYKGCMRGLNGSQNCSSFSNTLNYGGHRWIPQINPFNNNSLI